MFLRVCLSTEGGAMCGKKGLRAEETATDADGTHPTGMHSCECFIFGEEDELPDSHLAGRLRNN